MRILSVLSDAGQESVSLMRISEATGYPKPTCYHILETLSLEGYVTRVSQSEGYRLGPAIYYLTRYGRYEGKLVALCRPVLRWMERNSRYTTVLSVIHSHRKFIIDYVDDEQNLFVEHPQIRADDIYRTATGRVILAHMTIDEIREVYERYGMPQKGHWDKVTSYDSLIEELARLREKDVVMSDSLEDGKLLSIGYASPIFKSDRCIGAVGIALRTPDGMPSPEEEKRVISVLKKGVKEITHRLGYEE